MLLATGTVQERYSNMHLCAFMVVENGENSLQDFFSRMNVHTGKCTCIHIYIQYINNEHLSQYMKQ